MNDNYIPLKEAAERISGNDPLSDELLHYTLDEFLRKKDVEAIVDSGGGRFYCVRIMLNSWKSVTSPFYHTYKKPSAEFDIEKYEDLEEDYDPTTEIADNIKRELDKLSWFDNKLFEIFWTENHTISSLSRATGIPRTSISLSINRIRKHVKRNI